VDIAAGLEVLSPDTAIEDPGIISRDARRDSRRIITGATIGF
jgi:hypothetical protein